MLNRLKNTEIVQLYLTCADILKRYEISHTASSIAYYFTLSVFPFLMFLAALIGVLRFPSEALLQMLSPLLSARVPETLLSYYNYLTSVGNVFSLVFGLIFSLFSASRAVHALTYGVNKVYRTHMKRSYIKSMLLSIVFTIGISILLILMLFVISMGSNLPAVLDIAHVIRIPFDQTGYMYLIAVFAAFVTMTSFYGFAPVKRVRLRHAWPGSVFCILGLHLISFGVSFYVRLSTRFSVLYGSIGAIIIMLLWLYFFGICVMIGALLNRYFEMKKAR